MKATDVVTYIGLPWRAGATGPDEYDCWGLLRHIEAVYFNVYLPQILVGDEAACREMFDVKINSHEWESVQYPRHGDGVLLRGGSSPHVGVWLDFDGGGILHAIEKHGVIFTQPRGLVSLGFGRSAYYRFQK